ncbi:MAG: hypothetical protein JSR62_14235 [Nitrospira sp.]|nr:hypothetical protein [Nitrospira sp.]
MNIAKCVILSLLMVVTGRSTLLAQWSQLPGTDSIAYSVVFADDHYLFAGTQIGDMFRSADNGSTWEVANSGLPDSSIFVTLYGEPGLLLLGTGKGAFRSTDNGLHWQLVADQITSHKTVHQFFRLGQYLLMIADSGVARSTDQGSSWDTVHIGLHFAQSKYAIASNGGQLFLATQSEGVYRSIDSGVTWRPVNAGMEHELIYSLCAGINFILAGATDRILLYRSVDSGNSWSNLDKEVRDISNGFYALATFGDSNVIGISAWGVVHSTNQGVAWSVINDGLSRGGLVGAEGMCITQKDVLIAAVRYGIWRRPLSELLTPPSGVEDATTGATMTRLGQSIPNPTSGEVIIPYSLAASGHVSITLYNSLLQQVATVVDAEEPSGPHTARLEASALPPGAYYYRLHAGSVNLTRQMIVVR